MNPSEGAPRGLLCTLIGACGGDSSDDTQART